MLHNDAQLREAAFQSAHLYYTHGEHAAAPELKIGAYVHMRSYGVVVDGTEVWNTAEADGVTVKENKAYFTLSETSATISQAMDTLQARRGDWINLR